MLNRNHPRFFIQYAILLVICSILQIGTELLARQMSAELAPKEFKSRALPRFDYLDSRVKQEVHRVQQTVFD